MFYFNCESVRSQTALFTKVVGNFRTKKVWKTSSSPVHVIGKLHFRLRFNEL